MKPNIICKRGQAAVELAIFGSIILVAFSALLMYGQQLDLQQQVKMEAFRRALRKAYARNGSVNYSLKKEARPFNLLGGFGQGQPASMGSTASVLWQKGLVGKQGNADPESYAYYAINDKERELDIYPKKQKNTSGKKVTVYVPVSVYSEEEVRTEEYATAVRKEESPQGGIVNIRTSDLKDTVKTTPHVRFDNSYDDNPQDKEVPLPDYVYEGKKYKDEDEGWQKISHIDSISVGAYASEDGIDYSKHKVGTTIHKERTWETGN